jgi:hypothetical protein
MDENLNDAFFCQLVAARTPLVFITTDNESRTEALVTRAALHGIKGMPVPLEWNCNEGFLRPPGNPRPPGRAALGGRARRPRHLSVQGHDLVLGKQSLCATHPQDFAALRRPEVKTLVFIGSQPDIPEDPARAIF